MLKRKIHWVKFNLPKGKFEDDEEDDDESPGYMKYEESDGPNFITANSNMINTPLGVVSADNKEQYEKSYNMWTCHTNFHITKSNFMALNVLPGIEGLHPISCYRFNIVIGFLFEEDLVKKSVENVLIGDLDTFVDAYRIVAQGINPGLPKHLESQLNAAISLMDKATYAILILPNGKMVIVSCDYLTEEFCENLQNLHIAQNATNGYLYVHHNKKKAFS